MANKKGGKKKKNNAANNKRLPVNNNQLSNPEKISTDPSPETVVEAGENGLSSPVRTTSHVPISVFRESLPDL